MYSDACITSHLIIFSDEKLIFMLHAQKLLQWVPLYPKMIGSLTSKKLETTHKLASEKSCDRNYIILFIVRHTDSRWSGQLWLHVIPSVEHFVGMVILVSIARVRRA